MEPTILDRLLAISGLFQLDMQRAFAGTPLTEARVHALWVLHHGGPTTQQGLSDALGTTPRSVSALVDGLVSSGYAVREPHPTDRRSVLVSLTETARSLMERMQNDHQRLSEQLMEAIDEADRPAFERGVNAVFWRLDELVRNEAVNYG